MTEQAKKLYGKERYDFGDLCEIVRILRGEGGCPWDREQTHASIRNCVIEEAYEVAEAIDKNDADLLCEELGDLLFQSVFHAQLEQERGSFSIADVVNANAKKMIDRHPQVFGDEPPTDADEALRRWEAQKVAEKRRVTLSSRLRAIPAMLPALMRAQKVAEKAGLNDRTGYAELTDGIAAALPALAGGDSGALGQVLFDLCRLASHCGVSAETALFRYTEQVIETAENHENSLKN